ncbi:MAG: hypothetical protein M3N23_09630 [Pseudomonadota bacterium]|nr:hypothetical protein [Pseudomonadota bacterium]
MKTLYSSAVSALLSAALLSACGGGGSTSGVAQGTTQVGAPAVIPVPVVAPPSPPNPPVTAPTFSGADAQGTYYGTISGTPASASNTSQFTAIVLEDGSFFYGASLNNKITVMANGNATGGNGSLAATNTVNYDSVGHKVSQVPVLSASYVAKKSLNGLVSDSAGNNGSFTTTYNAAYDSAATVGALTGAYHGTAATVSGYLPGTLTIAADGAIAGSVVNTSATCNFTGSAVPRPTGKNLFNLTINFGSGCTLVGKTTTGVATVAFSNGVVSLNAFSILADRSDAFFVSMTN